MNTIEEKEIVFNEHDLIVSMTDRKGKITYANDIFCKIAGYSHEELIGKPHSIVRHSDMPRVVFKLLWDTVLGGKPISAFVKNRTKEGNYYWVKAYVAPIISNGEIIRIISYRRPISSFVKQEISKLYKVLSEHEKSNSLDETFEFMLHFLKERNLSYEQFIDRLALNRSISSPDALNIDVDSYYIDHMIFKTNILRSIALGKKDIKVTESCCCNFGKKLKSLEDMPFTLHPSWRKVHHYHNHVHSLMGDYVERAAKSATKDELNGILLEVEKDTLKLFSALRDVIDNYVEERSL
ncbi:PAS domain S-box protein [bacterium]|nr:PAS domain S-box protein [bacterium]MBU1994189.1 PAS domain S-box protein [bacterium]